MELAEIKNIVEGILFAMGGTVEPSKIAKALEIDSMDLIEDG